MFESILGAITGAVAFLVFVLVVMTPIILINSWRSKKPFKVAVKKGYEAVIRWWKSVV